MQNVDERPVVRARTPAPGLVRRAAYALAAEVRAVEQGHRARVQPDGSILVKSDSQGGSYLVRVEGVEAGVLVFSCTCPSGDYRAYLPVPCKHAALAGRRLEREGYAQWLDGAWRPRRRVLRAPSAA
jgi:hypothetical protein